MSTLKYFRKLYADNAETIQINSNTVKVLQDMLNDEAFADEKKQTVGLLLSQTRQVLETAEQFRLQLVKEFSGNIPQGFERWKCGGEENAGDYFAFLNMYPELLSGNEGKILQLLSLIERGDDVSMDVMPLLAKCAACVERNADDEELQKQFSDAVMALFPFCYINAGNKWVIDFFYMGHVTLLSSFPALVKKIAEACAAFQKNDTNPGHPQELLCRTYLKCK